MAIYRYDMNEMEAAEYEDFGRPEPLPKGSYKAVVAGGTSEISSTSGNEYISIELVISDSEQYRNRKVWDRIFPNSSKAKGRSMALHRMHEYLVSCGQSKNGVFDTDALKGKRVLIDVDIEEGTDGRKRNRVVAVNAIETAQASDKPAPETPDDFESDSF